ncbi:unnamed protein product [Arctia plantaginis]|uniref:Uncharacterized protein n=1 Tax=Arctia plantaginis TaxID=874455 RepID=A0A8S0ZFN2_ARCPL|nr:unnamed protein product [Arctia plantaginis]
MRGATALPKVAFNSKLSQTGSAIPFPAFNVNIDLKERVLLGAFMITLWVAPIAFSTTQLGVWKPEFTA